MRGDDEKALALTQTEWEVIGEFYTEKRRNLMCFTRVSLVVMLRADHEDRGESRQERVVAWPKVVMVGVMGGGQSLDSL